ncbi:MAG: hypothetical protein ABII23_01355 [bacterium]
MNMHFNTIFILVIFLIQLNLSLCIAEPSTPLKSAVYISDISNPAEFTLFANGGWDGSWYVGYNKCWIQKLEVDTDCQAATTKAFIGAKLGRMNTSPVEGKPEWESSAIPGNIYITITSEPAWKTNEKYYLTSTDDIPYEGLPTAALHRVGESRWFWVEVPLNVINFGGSNYIALWSSNKNLIDTASAPILAGGWDVKDKTQNTWIITDVAGSPPETLTGDAKPISYFEPAIAIKLIPINENRVVVSLQNIPNTQPDSAELFFAAAVLGTNIEKLWLEISSDGSHWERYDKFIYQTPYTFTLSPEELPKTKFKLRSTAVDECGNMGLSNIIDLENKQ